MGKSPTRAKDWEPKGWIGEEGCPIGSEGLGYKTRANRS